MMEILLKKSKLREIVKAIRMIVGFNFKKNILKPMTLESEFRKLNSGSGY